LQDNVSLTSSYVYYTFTYSTCSQLATGNPQFFLFIITEYLGFS